MSPRSRTKTDGPLFKRLAENTDESATVGLLTQLCRESPELRHWLWADFGRSAQVRKKFAEIVKDPGSLPATGFADLTNDNVALREEARRLREQFPARIYGGLTWSEVMTLVRHHQAAGVDLGAFVLARDWQKTGKASPLLMWAGIEFLDLAIASGHRRLLKHLNRALVFLKQCESKAKRRSALGFTDWWKLQVLFYLLKHPQASYTIRELIAHLTALGLKPAAQDLRRFCARNGIRRDMRAGRPRTRMRAKL
jgi:hypothetical protein